MKVIPQNKPTLATGKTPQNKPNVNSQGNKPSNQPKNIGGCASCRGRK